MNAYSSRSLDYFVINVSFDIRTFCVFSCLFQKRKKTTTSLPLQCYPFEWNGDNICKFCCTTWDTDDSLRIVKSYTNELNYPFDKSSFRIRVRIVWKTYYFDEYNIITDTGESFCRTSRINIVVMFPIAFRRHLETLQYYFSFENNSIMNDFRRRRVRYRLFELIPDSSRPAFKRYSVEIFLGEMMRCIQINDNGKNKAKQSDNNLWARIGTTRDRRTYAVHYKDVVGAKSCGITRETGYTHVLRVRARKRLIIRKAFYAVNDE